MLQPCICDHSLPVKGQLAGVCECLIRGRGSCLEALGPSSSHWLEGSCEGLPAISRDGASQRQHLKDLGACGIDLLTSHPGCLHSRG